MRAPDRLRACCRQPDMLHLPLRDQFLHRAGDFLDRRRGIDPMLIEQIDHLRLEPLERSVRHFLDVPGRLFNPPRPADDRSRSGQTRT